MTKIYSSLAIFCYFFVRPDKCAKNERQNNATSFLFLQTPCLCCCLPQTLQTDEINNYTYCIFLRLYLLKCPSEIVENGISETLNFLGQHALRAPYIFGSAFGFYKLKTINWFDIKTILDWISFAMVFKARTRTKKRVINLIWVISIKVAIQIIFNEKFD